MAKVSAREVELRKMREAKAGGFKPLISNAAAVRAVKAAARGLDAVAGASKKGKKINMETEAADRITFSAPAEEGWPGRLKDAMHAGRHGSMSATIRALLERGLK